jgi:hypothetical protein
VELAGGVSLSVLEVLLCIAGRDRAKAVSRRASSRVLVGLEPRLGSGDVLPGSGVEKDDGRILPMNVHRFLLGVPFGESAVSFGFSLSAPSSFEREESEDWRLYDVCCVVPVVP